MSNTREPPCFPLFCTTGKSFSLTKGLLQAAAKDKENGRSDRKWAYITSLSPQKSESPPLESFKSEFFQAEIRHLGFFCRTRFGQNPDLGLSGEFFGVIDVRSAKDRTMLLARWEEYTAADDAILRFVWGDTTAQDEELFLRHLSDPSNRPKYKEITEKWITTVPDPFQAASVMQTLKDETQPVQRARRLRSRADSANSATVDRSDKLQRILGIGETEVCQGWRTMRVPIATVMKDIELVLERSITDLLKHRRLFDKYGVLRR
ncbi:hypothetical protein EJ05DRAFT_481421 [Pseudovirgaria hyperparasitica]|uniref:Uncharacterized protein n=1 Tax=Pseudovirgaria hyperparasitica TaxID=470096 RepID=A0A6A6WK09_9PEZI|nr:uncharacterized protein EJ05DRAFT_481421 [Pseudovirgaria hyperparasitica]KAF2762487.1 hypothetical protein EJ05DRAFT_481421 [Pseudovirgaria hyperparasitica]